MHALNLCPSMSQAVFFKTLGGKEATPMPFAPVVMLPQAPLSGVQPPASAKPVPWVPLASQASYGVTLPPQSLEVHAVPAVSASSSSSSPSSRPLHVCGLHRSASVGCRPLPMRQSFCARRLQPLRLACCTSVLPWSPCSPPLQPLQLRLFGSALCLLAGLLRKRNRACCAALQMWLACCTCADLHEHHDDQLHHTCPHMSA